MNKPIVIIAIAAVLFLSKSKPKSMPKPTTLTQTQFIQSIAPMVKAEAAKIKVPYLAMIAQIILETNWGKSGLWAKYYNPGGIKAVAGQPFIELLTQEDADPTKNDGKTKTVKQKFARYKTPAEGIAAYGRILTNRYFKQYAGKTNDPKQYIALLQSGKPKYASDDKYAAKVATVIDRLQSMAV